jgi:flagellar protein FlaJ
MSPEVSDAFKGLETKKWSLFKTKRVKAEDIIEGYGPHIVYLPKEAVPSQIKLTPYQQTCIRIMGKKAKEQLDKYPDLEEWLLKSRIRMRPEEYLAYVLFTDLISKVTLIVLGLVFMLIFGPLMGFMGYMLGLILILMAFLVKKILLGIPKSKAKARARNIDKKLASAMSFVAALASADVNVDVIFKELSKQPIYGEIQKEAEWITRDTELLGIDILTAIKEGAKRSPSLKWQEFLQGVVTTSTSGGQLKPYFLVKLEEYEKENQLENKRMMETLGMLAESFVTVAVAFPLFLIVIMAIMAITNGQGASAIPMLYAIDALMIPGSQGMFIFIMYSMVKET